MHINAQGGRSIDLADVGYGVHIAQGGRSIDLCAYVYVYIYIYVYICV